MKYCPWEKDDFPDSEFFRRNDGGLMHQPQEGPPHRAERDPPAYPEHGPLRESPPER